MRSDTAAERSAPAAGVAWSLTTKAAAHSAGRSTLWSAASGSFDGPLLRRAIVARGWTAQEFAEASGLTPASIYSALRGRRVRDRTALKIFRALARREPSAVEE